MSELLPTVQADDIRESLLDFLTTTFALTDDDARGALAQFLGDPEQGLFKGPYVRLRLPFEAAAASGSDVLDWHAGPAPYGHQAVAFERLSSARLDADRPRPLPTLVTTGTGSGKTEAFLLPIIDHVLRAKRAGVNGTKALILYPMNALANDQAARLTALITQDPALAGITAALYTGQQGSTRTKVTRDGLITDRAVIRSSAPDILLTNYKMLDQLLLRHEDASLWAASATSLQYLVLDEFHTYDGAQGTDVSMLLRRLGLALKSHWNRADPTLSAADWQRPLGRLTPVATSATLGDEGDPRTMLAFAETVFGEPFDADAVVTETRQQAAAWVGEASARVQAAGYLSVDVDDDLVDRVNVTIAAQPERSVGRAVTEVVLGQLWESPSAPGVPIDLTGADEALLLDLIKAHPCTAQLVAAAAEAVAVADLAATIATAGRPSSPEAGARLPAWQEFLTSLLAAFSHVRAVSGRDAVSVDLHLWIRELTRVDRAAGAVPRYTWSDDGDLDDTDPDDATASDHGPALPAIYCRHCGRSGWAVVLAPTGSDLDTDDSVIRRRRMARDERFRPLVHAPGEGDRAALDADAGSAEPVDGLRWFAVRERRLLAQRPEDTAETRGGGVLPVLTHLGDDAGQRSLADTCPACQQKDGIRFLGSAIATMLSVSLSTLFGQAQLDLGEKKALVFTDSVQDAAHRAGFVQSRSFSLTLRAVLREAIGDEPLSLDVLVEQVIANAGDDAHRRYRLVPPEVVDRAEFAPFWQRPRLRDVPAGVRSRVKRRLMLDAVLEFGLQSGTGRTLERTGSVSAEVAAAPAALLRAADQAIEEAGGLPTLEGVQPPDPAARTAWVRGVLVRMRERGAIEHEWFRRYQQDDGGRYSIWGGRPRTDGMPAFPAGRAAPGFPRVGGAKRQRDADLDPVTTPQSWYALWAAKTLQLNANDGARLARLLMQRLAHLGLLAEVTSNSGAKIYQIAQADVVIAPAGIDDLTAGRLALACIICGALTPGTRTVVDQLLDAPCLVPRCPGRLARKGREDNFYRRMYDSTDIRRVVAREHTSLLDDDVRLAYENGFRAAQDDPQAPNVLVATPTLEMGIDIGDLSTVLLASLPRSVASYVQRVGRAGRLTGNALNLAFVTGRGDQLPRLGDPLSVINGEVRPPATYLDAEEILRRQYVASLADRIARDPQAPHPRHAADAIASTDPGSYLQALIASAEDDTEDHLEAFLAGLPSLRPAAVDALRQWVTPHAGQPGSSPLATRMHHQAQVWTQTVQTLQLRREQIYASIPALQQVAASPAATDEDKRAIRMARASLKGAKAQLAELQGEYWIGVLEEHGILPNYTLLDDSVALDVTLSWVDPDSGDYQTDAFSYHRGGTQALRDFAPGASFYAGGHRLLVDAVDLGRDGEGIQEWVFCPACGFTSTGPAAISTCRRCGSPAIADTAQRLEVVELKRVYSSMRRDDAVITDDHDERQRELFTVVTAADVDPAHVTRQWYVQGYDFGAKHLREQTIRWINLGKLTAQGPTRTLAAGEYGAAMFRLCSSCGQFDTASGANRASEHRPWCPHRKSPVEQARSLALARTLRTEGLVLRLPRSVTLGDSFALPSLAAAILLGLRERLGGAPDHIQIASTTDPTLSDGGDNHDALLLHDIVPGGTGYLAELADPQAVWAILHHAWRILRDCACQGERRLACHRCLLPFVTSHQVRSVSRAAAERHLRDILSAGSGEDPDAEMTWVCTTTEPAATDAESSLEQRFRAVLARRLAAAGATVKEQPTDHGNRATITLGGSGRVWTLEPQQAVAGSKPDFVLRCNQGGIPDVAIFTDGWRFHASPGTNRLADDARKRNLLRDSGFIVLAITWQDLDAAESGAVAPPPWFEPDAAAAIVGQAQGALSSASLEIITGGPLDLLMSWIQNPQPALLEHLAAWLPYFLVGASQHSSVIGAGLPASAAVEVLDDVEPTPAPAAVDWIWRHDSVALAASYSAETGQVSAAAILDDRTERLGPDRRESWHQWLRLSNLLNLSMSPTVITTRSLAQAAIATGAATTAGRGAATTLTPQWQALYDDATTLERALIVALAEAGSPMPALGEETTEGIVLSLTWPRHGLAVDIGLSEDDKRDLADRWTFVRPDPEAVITALTNGDS